LLMEKGEEGAFGGKERGSRRGQTKKKIEGERDRIWKIGEFVGAELTREVVMRTNHENMFGIAKDTEGTVVAVGVVSEFVSVKLFETEGTIHANARADADGWFGVVEEVGGGGEIRLQHGSERGELGCGEEL
jgi:hypothetical protein